MSCSGLGLAGGGGGGGQASTNELQVLRSEPAAGAQLDLPPDSIRVTVDGELDPATVTASSMIVTVSQVPVAGSVARDAAAKHTLVYRPTVALPAATTIDVVLASGVRSVDGRALRAPRSFSFSIRSPGASIRLEPTQVLRSGPERLFLAHLVRSAPGEIGCAFQAEGTATTHAAAFWSLEARSWSPLTAVVDGLIGPEVVTAADGSGGILVLGKETSWGGVHHGRRLASTLANAPSLLGRPRFLFRVGTGPTTAWSGDAAGLFLPASADWNGNAGAWSTNSATAQSAPESNLLTSVPDGAAKAQRIYFEILSSARLVIHARARDRFGVEDPPVQIAEVAASFPPVFATATNTSGRSLFVVQEAAAFGSDLVVIEHEPGRGWSAARRVAHLQGFQPFLPIAAYLADQGTAVIGVPASTTGFAVATRNAGGEWDLATWPSRSAGSIRVVAADDGTACAALNNDGDALVAVRRPGRAWSPTTSLREAGQLGSSSTMQLFDSQVAASTAGRFLMVQAVFTAAGAGAYVLQSVEIESP